MSEHGPRRRRGPNRRLSCRPRRPNAGTRATAVDAQRMSAWLLSGSGARTATTPVRRGQMVDPARCDSGAIRTDRSVPGRNCATRRTGSKPTPQRNFGRSRLASQMEGVLAGATRPGPDTRGDNDGPRPGAAVARGWNRGRTWRVLTENSMNTGTDAPRSSADPPCSPTSATPVAPPASCPSPWRFSVRNSAAAVRRRSATDLHRRSSSRGRCTGSCTSSTAAICPSSRVVVEGCNGSLRPSCITLAAHRYRRCRSPSAESGRPRGDP